MKILSLAVFLAGLGAIKACTAGDNGPAPAVIYGLGRPTSLRFPVGAFSKIRVSDPFVSVAVQSNGGGDGTQEIQAEIDQGWIDRVVAEVDGDETLVIGTRLASNEFLGCTDGLLCSLSLVVSAPTGLAAISADREATVDVTLTDAAPSLESLTADNSAQLDVNVLGAAPLRSIECRGGAQTIAVLSQPTGDRLSISGGSAAAVTVADGQSVDISGSNVELRAISADILVSGGSDIRLVLERAQRLRVTDGSVTAGGTVDSVEFETSSNSGARLDGGRTLIATRMAVSMRGRSSADVTVTDSVEGNMYDSSRLTIRGSPTTNVNEFDQSVLEQVA